MAVPLRAQPTPEPAPFVRGANAEAEAGPPTVVLLALDGVRWEDVFLGVIGRVLETLHDLRREGRRTTLFVTTDHGRAAEFIRHGGDAPESARVWLVAAGHGIAARGLAAAEAARTLVDLSQTIRHVGNLPPRGGGTPLVELLEDEAARVATR